MTTGMLRYLPAGSYTWDCLTTNGLKVGTIYQEVDGFYVVELVPRGGYLTQEFLMELATKLQSLNAEWSALIDAELASRPMELIPTLEDLALPDPYSNSKLGAL